MAHQEIEVDPTSGEAFLTQDGYDQGFYNKILVIGELGGPPSLTLDDASGVTSSAATVTGTITPNGPGATPYPNPTVTKYRVEFKKSADSGWSAFSNGIPIGSGYDPEPFSVGVGGLEPKTEYQVRIVATKPHGFVEVAAETAPFTTLGAPPRDRNLLVGRRHRHIG